MRRKHRGTALVLGVLTSLAVAGPALPAAGQSADPLPLRVEDSDVSAHPEVVITVSVPSEFVGIEIPAGAFVVLENGQEVDVAVAPLPSDDLEVVLVLDTSGSMAGGPLTAAQSAALRFIESMPPGVSVAVVEFANSTAASSPFTTDVEETKAAVLGLQAFGETALYDGLLVATDQFDPASQARRTIVLLSDGGDTVSASTLEEALVSLIDNRVSIYAIELQTPENDPEALVRLAAATGGAVVAATDPDALGGIFEEIAAQLTNRYQLSYQSEAFGPAEMTVSVEVDGATASATQRLRLPAEPPTAVPADPEPVAEPETEPATTRPGSIVDVSLWQKGTGFYVGMLLLAAGFAGAVYASRGLRRRRKSVLAHEQPNVVRESKNPGLTTLADRVVRLAERSLQGERGGRVNRLLEQAGISMRAGEFVVLTAIAAIVGAAIGYLVFAVIGALVGAGVALLLVRAVVARKAEKRKAAFADQLPDTLHLIAGSLRAGFGLLQAIEVIASESPSPTAEEFQRVKVEVHLGRDVDKALHAMAERVGSEDFAWVTDGIQIHREVGGDIAEIIDSVNSTIRARNQIRRRIRALSAEGRISAVVLIILPVVLVAFILIVNPSYVGELTSSALGRSLIAFAVIAMGVGVVWIKRIIRLEF